VVVVEGETEIDEEVWPLLHEYVIDVPCATRTTGWPAQVVGLPIATFATGQGMEDIVTTVDEVQPLTVLVATTL
jgi:hypothetical protein